MESVEKGSAATSRRSFRFQFSLRALLVFVLIFSIAMSWFAVKMNAARRQRQIVERFERLGGKALFLYDYQVPQFGQLDDPDPRPPGPAWLRKIVGDDFLSGVAYVDVEGIKLGDDDLAPLASLRTLRRVFLNDCDFPDAALRSIAALPRLENLMLGNTHVSDAGLEFLSGHKALRDICVNGTRITDQGIARLRGLTQLTNFGAGGTRVTGSGFAQWKGFSQLSWLGLKETAVSDEELPYIAVFSGLEYLALDDTKVTDAGMEYIRRLVKLKELSLRGTKVGDAGIAQLGGLRNLSRIDLSGTLITDAGLRSLRRIDRLTGANPSDTKVTLAGFVDFLDAHSRLESLNATRVGFMRGILVVGYTELSHSDVDALAGARHAKTIYIRDATLDEADLIRLRKALPTTKITAKAKKR